MGLRNRLRRWMGGDDGGKFVILIHYFLEGGFGLVLEWLNCFVNFLVIVVKYVTLERTCDFFMCRDLKGHILLE